MNSLYPELKKIYILLLAVVIAGSAQAQKSDYASNSGINKSRSNESKRVSAAILIGPRTEQQIMLRWAPFAGAVSHYVLERSVDGKNYMEAGVFFTGEWSEEPEYIFTDKFRKAYSGPLFYRLRVVGLDGTEVYTLPVVSGSPR